MLSKTFGMVFGPSAAGGIAIETGCVSEGRASKSVVCASGRDLGDGVPRREYAEETFPSSNEITMTSLPRSLVYTRVSKS